MAREQKVAVVTVHGTGDTAKDLDGDKWFQRGSRFTEQLRARLGAGGVESEIIPHLWSGANSAFEREKGADKLADRIKRLSKRYAGVHVIGHSHGGNVANDAAVLVKWGVRGDRKEKMHSLTTVGTPFFDVRTGWLQVLAGLLFVVLAWGSLIAFPITALVSLFMIFETDQDRSTNLALWGAYVVLIGGSVWFMMNMASQGVRRILRPRGNRTVRTSVFAIWHQNDEAIGFLQKVEELPVQPFSPGALFRGARGAAISTAVFAVLIVSIAFPLLYAFDLADVFGLNQTESAGRATDIFIAWFVGLLFAPAAFVIIYGLYRLIVGGITELGARGTLNRFAAGVLRGIAMGRDGDQVLGKVSTTSHTHPTVPYVISGECAARMQDGAAIAAQKLIEKYRWALFTVGGDSSTSITALTSDTMTWDSLIHTTYFDQPEMADVIADHILQMQRERAGG